jgi:cell wall-associated NlpC family hydrolase
MHDQLGKACPQGKLRRRAIALAAATASGLLVGMAAAVPGAAATTRDNPRGSVAFSRSGNVLTFSGWTYDPNAPAKSIQVAYLLDGRIREAPYANLARADTIRAGIGGKHGFLRRWTLPVGTHTICIRGLNIGPGTVNPTLGCSTQTVRPPLTVNQHVAAYAKTFVGRYRYTAGGRLPQTGFDCSGFTSYVYGHFGRKVVPLAQAQYQAFRRIAKSAARPGDLIFFHNGTTTWHVGVYMGNNMMVAAANPAQGIRHQTTTWWSNVTFGTITH